MEDHYNHKEIARNGVKKVVQWCLSNNFNIGILEKKQEKVLLMKAGFE
jgi:hypothetical protein